MTTADRSYAFDRTCPSCRVGLSAKDVVCPRCGGLPDLDSARLAAMNFIDTQIARFFGTVATRRPTFTRVGVLWALAVVPVLMGPPMLAFVLAILTLRDPASSSSERRHVVAILGVCVVNFAVTAWIDVALAGEAVRGLIFVKHAMEDWLRSLFTLRLEAVPTGRGFGMRNSPSI